MRIILAIVAAFAILPHHAASQILPSVTVYAAAAERVESSLNVQGDLIKPDADSIEAGGFVFIDILHPTAPVTITPKPESMREWPPDVNGVRLILIRNAKPPGYNISISWQVQHPTDAEITDAIENHAGNKAGFAKFIREHSADEIFQDSHTVKVGDPKPPKPPGPKPPEDPQARAVYEAAIKHKLPASECKTVSENMRAVIAEAVAVSSMTRQQMTAKIKSKNEAVTGGSDAWEAWEKEIPGIFNIQDTKAETVKAYEKIADGLEAVK